MGRDHVARPGESWITLSHATEAALLARAAAQREVRDEPGGLVESERNAGRLARQGARMNRAVCFGKARRRRAAPPPRRPRPSRRRGSSPARSGPFTWQDVEREMPRAEAGRHWLEERFHETAIPSGQVRTARPPRPVPPQHSAPKAARRSSGFRPRRTPARATSRSRRACRTRAPSGAASRDSPVRPAIPRTESGRARRGPRRPTKGATATRRPGGPSRRAAPRRNASPASKRSRSATSSADAPARG